MPVMRHKVFRVGLERLTWSWKFGYGWSPKSLADFRDRVQAFADEVGAENVVSITEIGSPQYMITVWYREEVKARAKPGPMPMPMPVGVDDEYFVGSGG